MAATTNIFTEKETNNWFKACIALNVTKEGLTNFLESELKNVFNAVGISCGQCSIENLMPCPTQGLCKKRKPYKCTFHTSHLPKSCQPCDQVKQNIKSLHRFNGPSWRNTKAGRWATGPWEIGKCYLPPDGYSDVSSVQESDFNGVISILLNCTHFQSCLSPALLSPPPPDKQCPLETIRQIGRDVRHTANCKVTDANLQDYFKSLTTLLADPICLLRDPTATEAHRKLSDLQNDRLSLTELGELLKEAKQTIKHAKEVGERLSKEAERTLTEGLNTLEATTQAGLQRIESETSDSIERIKQAVNEKGQDDYKRGLADLLRLLVDHYRDTVSFVPLSTLDPSHDKQVHDIYASPKIHRMKIENDGRRTKQEQVFTYTDLFYRDNKLCRRTYLQGEPGSGKTTFVAKLVNDWCNVHAPSMGCTKVQTALVDVDTLQKFKFLFFIALRDSRNQTCVTQMIKTQLIDKIFADSESEDAYKLVLQIMKTFTCLIIHDGLDEWPGEDAVPTLAGIHKDHCIVLTTSRPWKLADERIRNSQIDVLLDLEGISDHRAFNEKVLRCLLDESTDFKETVKQFEIFLRSRNLQSILTSPMLLTLVLCTWVDGTAERLSGSSLCELYTILLENLCKKANPSIRHFNKSQPAPVNCFSRTKYIKPNMLHINAISKAAFSFLFSNERELSIVFNDIELTHYLSANTQKFALKSGLLSIRKRTKCNDNTCSFVHKSVQEFLAAFHISSNVDVINGVISGYLKRHHNSYLDISQVFVFLCGMNITAANKLSELMNIQDIAQVHELYTFDEDYDFKKPQENEVDTFERDNVTSPWSEMPFHDCIVSGYMEAANNKNTLVDLHLSYFCFDGDKTEYLFHIWEMNASRARSLHVCHFRKHKHVTIRSKDASSARSKGPGSVFIPSRDNPGPSARETQEEVNSSASFNLTLFHNMELLDLAYNVTVQPDALVGLKNLKFLKLYQVKCEGLDLSWCQNLEHLYISTDSILLPTDVIPLLPNPFVGLKKLKRLVLKKVICEGLDLSSCHNLERLILVIGGFLQQNALVGLKKLKYINIYYFESYALDIDLSSCVNVEELRLYNRDIIVRPDSLMGMKKLKHLELTCTCERLDLSYHEQIETLAVDCKVILLPLSTQNYKSLKHIQILSTYDGLDLSSLENLESIKISEKVNVLPKQLLIRNNKKPSSISLYEFNFNTSDNISNKTWCLLNGADTEHYVESTQVLPSIKRIELTRVTCSSTWLRNLLRTLLTIDHKVHCDLEDCQITSSVEGAASRSLMRQCVTITTNLNNTVKIKAHNDYPSRWDSDFPGLWESVYDLSIKSLRVDNNDGIFKINHGTSFSQSLRSLSLLETLKTHLATYIDLQLPQSLKHVTLFYDTLSSSLLRDLLNKLSALFGPLDCRIEFGWSHETVNEGDPHKYLNNQFPTEEYFLIKEELKAREKVEVKRFRIYDRSVDIDNRTASEWTLRCGAVDDGDHSNDMAYDRFYRNFEYRIKSFYDLKSRVSIRLQINCVYDPA